jgi:hypothetical protein
MRTSIACSAGSGPSGRWPIAVSAPSSWVLPAERPSGRGFGARLASVDERLVPPFGLQGVVSEPLDLLGKSLPGESLDCFDNPSMHGPAAFLEQSPVGDLVRERVFEGIFEIGKQPYLVEELRGLEMAEAVPDRVLSQFGDRQEQRKWHILADHGRGLQEVLFFGGESINPRRQHRLNAGRHLKGLDGLGQTIGAALADQRPRLHEFPHALLEKERVTAPEQELLEGGQPGVGPHHVGDLQKERNSGRVTEDPDFPPVAIGVDLR